MLGIENFLIFIITAFLFIMTPGIDTVFILNKSLTEGKKGGIYSTLGINSGVLVHTLFAALGLSVIVAQSATAFSILKYFGAGYLIYLGVKTLISKENKLVVANMKVIESSPWKNFRIGFITNTLNPKVALFFLSFFPQFIAKEQINNPIPFLILGITYALIGVIWFMILVYFSAIFSSKIKNSPSFSKWLSKCSGAVYVLMGIKIALTKK